MKTIAELYAGRASVPTRHPTFMRGLHLANRPVRCLELGVRNVWVLYLLLAIILL